MTKYFAANEKKLKKRYNRWILILNLPPAATVLTLLAVMRAGIQSAQPVSFYYGLTLILTGCVGYSFLTVWISSAVMTKALEGHRGHTYVQILNRHLVVSRHLQTIRLNGEKVAYKKLWLIPLSDIEDIYYYKQNVIVVAPARVLQERADWLTYTFDRNGVCFDHWWYDSNGGKRAGGVEIPDMFLNARRVARTIENASGRMQQKDAERRQYRERMLEIAQGGR